MVSGRVAVAVTTSAKKRTEKMLLFFFARYSHFVRQCKCSLTDLIRAELICHPLCSPSLSFSFTRTLSLVPNCQTVVVFSFVFFLHFVFIAILVELPLRIYFIACRSALCADLPSRSPPLSFAHALLTLFAPCDRLSRLSLLALAYLHFFQLHLIYHI